MKDKLITEFMGETGEHEYKSWNYIIPVVEKIESLDLSDWMYKWEGIDGEIEYNFEGISVEIENKRCWIYINLSLDPYWTINEKAFKVKYETKLEAVYESVVEFIEWYNERKQREDESKTRI